MSVPESIEKHVPGGLNGDFGKLCYMDVISEYGGPPENQSALNLIYMLGYNDSTEDGYQSPSHPMLAGSDEQWHIRAATTSSSPAWYREYRTARSLSAIR